MIAGGTTHYPRARGAIRAALTLGAALAFGCSGPTGPGREPVGPVSGRWDGVAWSGRGYAVIENGSLNLFALWQDPRYHYDEHVTVLTAFSGPGTYQIDAGKAYLAKLVGGDAGSIQAASGVLHVAEYDPRARRVRGTLTLMSSEGQAPATFDEGTFDVPVYRSSDEAPALRCRRYDGSLCR